MRAYAEKGDLEVVRFLHNRLTRKEIYGKEISGQLLVGPLLVHTPACPSPAPPSVHVWFLGLSLRTPVSVFPRVSSTLHGCPAPVDTSRKLFGTAAE